jgi:hypothetical protein
VEKSSPQNQATSVVFKKLPKENNGPLGKNSSNLVTLFETNANDEASVCTQLLLFAISF